MNYPSGNNRIGYSLKAAGSRFFVGINPVGSSEIPNRFVQATPEEVSEACNLAATAFPVYAQMDLSVRQQFVDCIVAEIRANQDRLMELMSLETGLPLARAKTEASAAQWFPTKLATSPVRATHASHNDGPFFACCAEALTIADPVSTLPRGACTHAGCDEEFWRLRRAREYTDSVACDVCTLCALRQCPCVHCGRWFSLAVLAEVPASSP